MVSPSSQHSKGFSVETMKKPNITRKSSKYEASSRVTLAGNWGPESNNLHPTAMTAQRVIVNDTKFGSSGDVTGTEDKRERESGSFG